MISSIDTYVYNKIEKTLNRILKEEYIVDNALARLDKEARDNFKRAFTGENPRSTIEMGYQFPEIKETFDARIVVQLGKGAVSTGSLGNVEGTFAYRELGKVQEQAVVETMGEDRLGVTLENHIGEIVAVEEVMFTTEDEVDVEEDRITFSKRTLGLMEGNKITIHYIAKEPVEGEEPYGTKVGYTSQEQVMITPLSTNMDTARSLDLIMKVVLIIMMESAEEKDEYLLQNHTFGEMQNIVPEPLDRLVFGRPITLNYTVSHSLDFDYEDILKEINVENRQEETVRGK